MNLHEYQAMRQLLSDQMPQVRATCHHCRQSKFNCYCAHVQRFDPQITFVILIHPVEVQRRIATGRMSHLCLENSYLIEGENFSKHEIVNGLIADPSHQCVMLYPGQDSVNLSELSDADRSTPFASDRKLVIFVIDGTWATARKMVRYSRNLGALPRICFSLDRPSNFRVRKQPAVGCYSTIEAIHQAIELVGPFYRFPIASRRHDNLLTVFDKMVE
ncbi:MAG: tRNA-uridine aminocarboxypropyltransferase, partial [Burkholderiaceae bacterium]